MDLHGKIMNIEPNKADIAKAANEVVSNKIEQDYDVFTAIYIFLSAMYQMGFRDARHAAAELATKGASNE